MTEQNADPWGDGAQHGPGHRGPSPRRRPDRGRQDRRRRRRDRGRRRGRRRHRAHRDPRVRRHPPTHLGGGDPRLRPERDARRLLRRGARHVRAGLPARGRLRQQPGRLAGVPQRRHHHARRLVAHQQHPRAPGRRGHRAPGDRHPLPSTPTAAPTCRWPTTGSTARSPSPATTYAGSGTRTSARTTACSPWAWPPAVPGSAPRRWSAAEWALARELDIPITVHVAMGRLAGRFGMVKHAARATACSARTPPTSTAATSARRSGSWSRTAAAASRSRRRSRCRWGTAGRRCSRRSGMGLRPSLSIDVVTTVPGDMFTQMRAAFGTDRARVHDEKYEPNEQVPKDVLTAREMLHAATVDGAHVAGLEDKVGTLTPGQAGRRRADRRHRAERGAGDRPGGRGRALRGRVERGHGDRGRRP